MAVIRAGHQAVLLVVDVQVGVMRDIWEASRVIHNIAAALHAARSQGVPVIWVQHADSDLVEGSPDWQIVPELKPDAGEALICKNYNSSFEQTPLEDTLAQLKASHIVLAGAATNWCIRATAYAALDRGYDLTLVSDAHTTGSIELESGGLISAESIIDELNIVMTWLSYPGRINNAVPAGQLSFNAPSAPIDTTP